ncbi:cytochrome P450, partial [Zychaea mexicana]|uniref:cytochrome P450 n=1 Tax=Zychaea mexicana TaxID=64656 RepID=UPI0022FE67A0
SCLCLAGSKVGHNQDLVISMANFTQKVTRAGITLAVLPEWIANFLIKRHLSVESQIDLIMDLLVPEMEKIRAGEVSHDDEPSYAAMVLNLPKANGQLRTPQEAAFYFKNIVLASIHTTTTFASFALHELACRPALQAELRAEIEKLGNDRTPETVSQIRLLDSLLREVLRYDTSYLGMHHKALDNVILSTGQMIPRGSLVLGAMYDAHICPAYMPETAALGSSCPLDQFDAHRFMHANDDSSCSSASSVGPEYMTFGMFAHACPGRYFAVDEIKYILAEMIMRYDLTTKSGKRAKDYVLRGITRFPPREPLEFTGRSITTTSR